jgi:hypothetical protein
MRRPPGTRAIRRANVNLGSARRMDAEAAGQKARKMKEMTLAA